MAKQAKNSGRWEKGMQSPNPEGRRIAKAKAAPGSDGVIAYGGHIQTGEGSHRLTGRQRWVEYANAWTFPPVAIWAMLRNALIAGATWKLEENPVGGDAAKRGIEITQRGLLDAPLPTPWSQVAAKALMADANGFSVHAGAMGRRKDGLVVYTDLGHRPPHTIEEWHRDNPQTAWRYVRQRIDDGQTYDIPLDECLYLTDGTLLSDSPEGVGFLRLVVERLRRIAKYEALEGSELFSSMGGIPIARVPLEEIVAGAGGDEEKQAAAVRNGTAAIEGAIAERIKTPEKQQYLKLDSATYKGSNPDSISTIPKWGLEIVKGELQGLPEIRKIISDLYLDVARMLGDEFVFIGGGDTAGTQSLHESKTSVFAQGLQSGMSRLAVCADRQLVRRLVRANGLDPDVAAPYLVPQQIGEKDIEKKARTLGLVQMAGLPPNHPAKIAFFEDLGIPWQDEEAGLMLPSLPRFATPDLRTDEPKLDDVEES